MHMHTNVFTLMPTRVRTQVHTPVHQDLADLDALAALSQRRLHGFPTADHAHAA